MTALTFLDLQQKTLRHLDEATSTGATTLALAKDFLNQAHRHRCTQERWPFMLWEGAETIATVAGTATYTLNPEFHRPLYFWNRTQNRYLTEVPFRALEGVEPYTVTQTSPLRYGLWNRSPVAAQPAAASVVTLVSTSAGDTGATYAVSIRGISGSQVTTVALNPNGLTAASTSATFTKILGVTLTKAFAGTLTLSAGATTLLTLSAGEYNRTYPILNLLDLPSTAETIEYRFFRQPITMIGDYDLPDIPAPHTEILVWDALILFAGYNTNMASKSLQVWTDIRDRMDRAMSHDLLDGTSIAAQARFIRTLDPLDVSQ